MAPRTHQPCLPHALPLPAINKMSGKRVVLASASPRRKEILENIGLALEIVPSTFEEDLPQSTYADDLTQYPVATAGEKALEVYQRLVIENLDDAPDLVISADTVVLFPPINELTGRTEIGGERISSMILEKPDSPGDNLRMLMNMNGQTCQVVTAITIIYPTIAAPGYQMRSLTTSSLVKFFDNPRQTLEAYVDSKDGEGKAGGFGIQGLGSLLVERIEGDYTNIVGFPAAAFLRWLEEAMEEDDELLNL